MTLEQVEAVGEVSCMETTSSVIVHVAVCHRCRRRLLRCELGRVQDQSQKHVRRDCAMGEPCGCTKRFDHKTCARNARASLPRDNLTTKRFAGPRPADALSASFVARESSRKKCGHLAVLVAAPQRITFFGAGLLEHTIRSCDAEDACILICRLGEAVLPPAGIHQWGQSACAGRILWGAFPLHCKRACGKAEVRGLSPMKLAKLTSHLLPGAILADRSLVTHRPRCHGPKTRGTSSGSGFLKGWPGI